MKTKHILREQQEKFNPYNFLKTAMDAGCFPKDPSSPDFYLTKYSKSYNKTECDKGTESTTFNPCGYALFKKSGKPEYAGNNWVYVLPNQDKTFKYIFENEYGEAE